MLSKFTALIRVICTYLNRLGKVSTGQAQSTGRLISVGYNGLVARGNSFRPHAVSLKHKIPTHNNNNIYIFIHIFQV